MRRRCVFRVCCSLLFEAPTALCSKNEYSGPRLLHGGCTFAWECWRRWSTLCVAHSAINQSLRLGADVPQDFFEGKVKQHKVAATLEHHLVSEWTF